MKVIPNNCKEEIGGIALTESRQAVLPFSLRRVPITKLVIIGMESHPDTLYKAFELQYFDGEPYGKGYRVLAYRLDRYVDVYDSNELKVVMEEHINIVESGLGEYLRVDIHNVALEYGEDGFFTHFEFIDKLGRRIEIHIKEHTRRNTKPMSLLAPVGWGAEKPDCLPVYLLHQFDFVRKHKTSIHVLVDGTAMILDKFPSIGIKDRQKRTFIRYSMDAVLLEFAKAQRDMLEKVDLAEDNSYVEENMTYIFEEKDGEMGLTAIHYKDGEHNLEVRFDRGMYLQGDYDMYVQGRLVVTGQPDCGILQGSYEYKRTRKRTILRMLPKEGWFPPRVGMLARFMLSKKSIFRTWPKTYRYTQAIEWDTMQSHSQWSRIY